MVDLQHRNSQDDFLQPETPIEIYQDSTPKPLRIAKISPNHSGSSAASHPLLNNEPKQQWAAYNIPPSTSAAVFGGPASPPPTRPLPQPDGLDRFSQSKSDAARSQSALSGRETAAEGVSSAEQPARQRKTSMSSDASSGAGSGASAQRRRPHFDANDPNRPTAAGYSFATPPPLQTATAPNARSGRIYPESPGGPEPPDKEEGYGEEDQGLFSQQPNPRQNAAADTSFQQQFYPPPLIASTSNQLHIPNPAGINRLDSTASTHTTRASRGSPPPPETPIDPQLHPSSGLGDIEARYAASGIPGTSTLNEMQAQSAAAAARRAQYASPQPLRGAAINAPQRPVINTSASPASSNASSRRWSPTEHPGESPHGPPIAFVGTEEISSRLSDVPSQASHSSRGRENSYPQPPVPALGSDPLHADMAQVSLNDEPPPAYSPPTSGSVQQFGDDKRQGRPASPAASAAGSTASSSAKTSDPNIGHHPAFAIEQSQARASMSGPSTAPNAHSRRPNLAAAGVTPINTATANATPTPPPVGAGPASPPPLPEGWIAHLDNSSGQYYYIHLPSQSTQWEFPKGPTPLSMQEPMSPVGSYANPLASPVGSIFKQPIGSPSFGPVPIAGNIDSRASVFSMSTISSPTAAGFSGPPPSAGVDLYKIAPTNGVYFGPYLRYTNMDLERGLWLGSIMLVTDAAQPPTIHIHQSSDLSPNPRQLKAHAIHSHQRFIFYRYDIDLRMEEDRPAKWTYAITSHLGCTRYEFLVAGRHEQSWRWVSHSGNDFEISVNANERAKLGGVGVMWKDILQKHTECGGFHAQIGLGGQISADRLWKDLPALRQWTQISGKDNRRNAAWNAQLEEDVVHAYFHYYTSHFDQTGLREAFAQIPHVCCLDDQDIFDGFGSYPEYMQQSHFVKNIGRIGIDMFLLFQHHTNLEILRNVSNDIDLFTITGTGWHFLKYFGPSVVIVGPDTRSERTTKQVMAGPTYQGIFPKVAVLPPSVQHCIWLFPVPLLYPRLDNMESIANTVATGKKVVTGSFNALGKIAGGVAGVVGAKGVVNQGFEGVKKAMGKSGLMQGVLNPFGDIDMLDELRDMWTHESKVGRHSRCGRLMSILTMSQDLERTYIIRTLQGVSHNKSLRMTFLSGSVNSCGAGLVHDPSRPSDHKTMYQLITAPVVNAPAPSYVIRMLHTDKNLFVPQNGHRSSFKGVQQVTDTKEDMMEIFAADVNGAPREHKRLMGRRNYLACVAYDPEVVSGSYGKGSSEFGGKGPAEPGRISLAADFMVQNDSMYNQPMKYGPVIIPGLEYGR